MAQIKWLTLQKQSQHGDRRLPVYDLAPPQQIETWFVFPCLVYLPKTLPEQLTGSKNPLPDIQFG